MGPHTKYDDERIRFRKKMCFVLDVLCINFFPFRPEEERKRKKNMYNIANMVTTAKAVNNFFFAFGILHRTAMQAPAVRPGTYIMSRLT